MGRMDTKRIRDASIGLGAIGMVAISWFEAVDLSKDDDPLTDLVAITISSSATGPQISAQDTV